MVCAAVVSFSILIGQIHASWGPLGFIGLLIALALLTDPMVSVSVVGILLFLSLSALQVKGSRNKAIREALRRVGIPIMIAASIGLLFVIYLILSDSLHAFIDYAILFNTQVYSRYTGNLLNFNKLYQFLINGLDIGSPLLLEQTSFFYRWSDFTDLDTWIFTGWFFRFSAVVFCLIMLKRGQLLGAGYIYFLAGSLLFRGSTYFYGSTFVLFSLTSASIILFTPIKPRGISSISWKKTNATKKMVAAVLHGGSAILILGLALMFFWLNARVLDFWGHHSRDLKYSYVFSNFEDRGAFYNAATCYQKGTFLLTYPLSSMDYIFAQIPPASKFTFMTPWVAEVAQQSVISEIQGKPVLIHINKDTDIWGYKVNNYLDDLIGFLDQQFFEIEPGIYQSPELQKICEGQKE